MSSQPPFTPLLVSPLGLLLLRSVREQRGLCAKIKNQEIIGALPRPLVVHKEHKQLEAAGPVQGGH